jgi:4'-phosphopantetheinyl transferase
MHNQSDKNTFIVENLILESTDNNEFNYTYRSSVCLLKANYLILEAQKENFLHSEELKKLASFDFPLRKNSYLLGRFAAKKAIIEYLNNSLTANKLLIENGLYGEPKINNLNLNISISHSDNFAFSIAISHLIKIGIDIECFKNFKALDYINIADKEALLFESVSITNKDLMKGLLWSAKEALVKYLEIGLTMPLELLELETIQNRGYHLIFYFKNFPILQVVILYTNTIVLAICISKKILIRGLISLHEKLQIFP